MKNTIAIAKYDYFFYRIARAQQVAIVVCAQAYDLLGAEWTLSDRAGSKLHNSQGKLVVVRASEQELRDDNISPSLPICWR